jgi:uncharacterized metal-binding protein YceD (DUF177 family)
MAHGLFVVPLPDLERGPREVSWTLTEAWLGRALEGTDVTPRGDGRAEVKLTKQGRQVLVQGKVVAEVTVPDARSLDPIDLHLEPEIFLMLQPAPETEKPQKGGKKRRRGPADPGKKRGSGGWPEDPELTAETAGADTYQGEQVVLDEYFREFLLLDLPMVVRKDLNSEPAPAIAPPPESARPLDPRLRRWLKSQSGSELGKIRRPTWQFPSDERPEARARCVARSTTR